MAIYRREGLGGLVAIQALHGWGEALFAQARPNRAIAMFTESLALARAAGDRSYQAENLMMLDFAYAGFSGIGQYSQAIACFDEASRSAASHSSTGTPVTCWWAVGMLGVARATIAQVSPI